MIRRLLRRGRRHGKPPSPTTQSLLAFERLEERTVLAAPAADDVLLLDFGQAGSDVAAGTVQVTPGSQFTDGQPFGFVPSSTDGLYARNRAGIWGDHSRDFVEGELLEFCARLKPNYRYQVRYGFGDPLSERSQSISIEGEIVEQSVVARGELRVVDREFVVSSDGILDLVIRTNGPTPALLNFFLAVPIEAVPEPDSNPDSEPVQDTYFLDFGQAGSAVKSGLTQVTEEDVFGSERALGFVSSDSVQLVARNRLGLWGDHSRDFVEGERIAFSLRLRPNQRYAVRYGYGDPLSARAQSLSLEGVVVEQQTVAKGQIHVAEREVVVSSDGILDLVIRPDGPQPALINVLYVSPLDSDPEPDPEPDPDPEVGPHAGGSYQLDFGTAGSAVQSGMTRVTQSDSFGAGRNFGFVPTASTPLAAYSREPYWGDHSRDFVGGKQIGFSLRVTPNEPYTIRYGFGDPLSTRSQTISIEGRIVEETRVPKGSIHVAEHEVVASSDGILDIVLRTQGVLPAVINFLVVHPVVDVACAGYDTASAPAWTDIFPESGAPTLEAEPYGLTCSSRFVEGTSWVGLDERQVFAHRFEATGADQEPQYEFRLGQGSQLYSLRFRDSTGVWREAVPTQRSPETNPGRVAEWVDEVIQTAIVDTTTSISSDGDEATLNHIHQAGTYRNVEDVPTFYSPVLSEAWLPEERAHASLVWPQEAHIPSNFESHFLVFQQIRDLGSGVLEFEYVYQNYSTQGESVDFLAAPWFPIRDSSLPIQLRSEDGKLIRQQQTWYEDPERSSGRYNPIRIDSTDGYFVFASGTDPDDTAIALVFGTDVNNEGQFAPTVFRWGTHPSESRDLTVASVPKRVPIDPGEIFYVRFYVVVDALSNVRRTALALQPYVNQGYLAPDPTSASTVGLIRQGDKIVRSSGEQDEVLVEASTAPQNGWVPLLVATHQESDQQMVTNDPYLLARRPYLREYEFHDILGWISPDDALALTSHPDPLVAQRFAFSL